MLWFMLSYEIILLAFSILSDQPMMLRLLLIIAIIHALTRSLCVS